MTLTIESRFKATFKLKPQDLVYNNQTSEDAVMLNGDFFDVQHVFKDKFSCHFECPFVANALLLTMSYQSGSK